MHFLNLQHLTLVLLVATAVTASAKDPIYFRVPYKYPEPILQADNAAIEGSKAYAKGDRITATRKYITALKKLPDEPSMKTRRDAYQRQLLRCLMP
ncbi:MAG: hypothetical protein AAF226_07240 [Verrucomicrobiota bacterium]